MTHEPHFPGETDADRRRWEESLAGHRAKLERDVRALLGDRLVDVWMAASETVHVVSYLVQHPVGTARVVLDWYGRRA